MNFGTCILVGTLVHFITVKSSPVPILILTKNKIWAHLYFLIKCFPPIGNSPLRSGRAVRGRTPTKPTGRADPSL